MKKFLSEITILVLALIIGYLVWNPIGVRRKSGNEGWEIANLRTENQMLRDTRVLLEMEKRDLQTQVAAGNAAKPEEQAETRAQIERQTAALRGLPFKKPVTYKMIGRDDLRKVLETKLGEQYSAQELRDYGRTLETLGLIPEGTDLHDAIVGLYDEQVAAFYIPEERALYTFKNMSLSSNLDRVTLAHELTHALQDQNYDLTTFPLKVKDNDDLALATSALVEGDATVLMAQYYGEHLDVSDMLSDVMGGMLGQKTAKFQAAPPFFREMMLFPYQQGTEFAMAVFAAGGTDALNEAFKHPPVSTQQILHPEKYLHDRRDPKKIALAKRVVTGSPSSERGWRLIGDNVLGEFGVRSLLSQQLGVLEAQRIAAGWNGDRYLVYERGSNGPTALVWTTAWTTEKEAGNFADAYRRLADKRGITAELERDGTHVRIRQAKDHGTLDELK